MKSEDDRDRAVERLLRQSSAGAMGSPRQDDCLDAEIAAAWADGNLLPRERAAVESHVSACARCQALVATLVRTAPAVSSPEPWWQRGWGLGWLVPLAAGAAAVILWVVTPNDVQRAPSAVTEVGTQTVSVPEQDPAALADRFEPPAPERERLGAATGNSEARAATDSRANEQTATSVGRSDEMAASGELSMRPADRAEENEVAKGGNAAPAAPSTETPAEAVTATGLTPVQSRMLSRQEVSDVREIASPDPAIRWRIGTPGLVQYSEDGGATWQALATGVTVDLTAGASPSSSVCWLVGRAGAILLTTDGRRWQRVPFPEPADLVAVQAVDARTATVSAGDGRRFRTTDGGTTWVQLPLQEF